MSTEFLITTLIVIATPGTGVLYTLVAGLSRGARASIVAALGCTLGIVPHMVAAITGVAALLHASALAFELLRAVGVAYLLYMAWTTWRDAGALVADDSRAATRTPGAVILSGILINLLNPKLTIFFFAFLPQFVPAGTSDPLVPMLELSGVFMLLTFAVFVVYGVLAASVRRYVVSQPRVLTWTRRTFAVAFVGMGARLAVTDR